MDTLSQYIDYNLFFTEYERGLLSLALRNKDLLVELKQKVTAEYFLYPAHKIIFTALNSLSEKKEINNIDIDSLIIECSKLGFKNTNVNTDYLLLLSDGGFDVENFQFYLSQVRDAYLKYTLSNYLSSSVSMVVSNSKNNPKALTSEELLDKVNEGISKLLAFKGSESDGITFSERVDSYLEERSESPKEIQGLETGFRSIDLAINGLMPGTLTVVAGRPGEGKSTTLLNIVDHIAHDLSNEQRVPILILSTEMYSDEDLSRLIAMRTLLPERSIANGTAEADPKYRERIDIAREMIKSSQIYHVYTPDFNAAKICNYIYHYKVKYKIGLAIFDYIKLDTVGNSLGDKREDQVLGDLTTALKNTAGKLGIPIVAACQINRAGLVSDSDRILRYCNNLIEFRQKTLDELGDNEDYRVFGTHWLIVKKARSGSNIKVPVRFWKSCLKLEEAERRDDGEEVDREVGFILTTPDELQRQREESFKVDLMTDALSSREELLEYETE